VRARTRVPRPIHQTIRCRRKCFLEMNRVRPPRERSFGNHPAPQAHSVCKGVQGKVRYLDTSGPSMARRSTRPWERTHLLSTDWGSDISVYLCISMAYNAPGEGLILIVLRIKNQGVHMRGKENKPALQPRSIPDMGKEQNYLMDIVVVRSIFALVLTLAAYYIQPFGFKGIYTIPVGLGSALGIIYFEHRLKRATLKRLIGAAFGSIMGIIGAVLISDMLTDTV